MDIDAALEAMEMALLRESSSGLENNDEIVQLTGNGHTIVNSVKLGQSFKEYIPRERLQFLFKLALLYSVHIHTTLRRSQLIFF